MELLPALWRVIHLSRTWNAWGSLHEASVPGPGTDYRAFELAPEIDRAPAYDLGLSDDQARRAAGILADHMAISLHEHPKLLTDLEAVLASDDSAEALKVAVGYPVARALQTVLGPGNVPLAYEVTTHRTDVIRIRITR